MGVGNALHNKTCKHIEPHVCEQPNVNISKFELT